MTEIHNAELTQEIVIGAVAAWLEQTNDTALNIDVTYQRDINQNSNQDLIAKTKIDILKATDFRPMKRGHHNWCEDDQKMIDEMPRRGSNDQDGKGVIEFVRESYEKWSKPSSSEPESRKESIFTKKWSDKVEKRVAVKWELPSAEYYPIRYDENIRRNLNIRKPCGEVQTAHEALAVREKGDANDRTDQDCLTLPNDLHSAKESIASSESSIQREKSPERKPEPIEPPKPVEEKAPENIPEKIPEKVPEKVPEEPKVIEEVKKVEEEPKKVEEPKKEEPKKEEPKKEDPPKKEEPMKEEAPKKEEEPPKVEEMKKEEEVKKVVEEKKDNPPVAAVTEKKPKKKAQINIKRHPDSGELTILEEKDGLVTFTCSTQPLIKKSSKKND